MNMKSQSSIQIQQKERCRAGCRTSLLIAGGCSCFTHFSYFTTIPFSLHHDSFCRNDFFHLYNKTSLNHRQSKVILSTSLNSVYDNNLHVRSRLSGLYKCIVGNSISLSVGSETITGGY